ncbi:hypothetical protein THAOC_16509, partial [Thalassiosira oceanica]
TTCAPWPFTLRWESLSPVPGPSRKETRTTLKGWPLDQAAEADVLLPRSASHRVAATVAVPSDIGVTIMVMTDHNGLHLQVVVRRGRVRQPRQREQQRPIRDQIERKEDGVRSCLSTAAERKFTYSPENREALHAALTLGQVLTRK